MHQLGASGSELPIDAKVIDRTRLQRKRPCRMWARRKVGDRDNIGKALLIELPNCAAADRFWNEEPFAKNGGYSYGRADHPVSVWGLTIVADPLVS